MTVSLLALAGNKKEGKNGCVEKTERRDGGARQKGKRKNTEFKV